MSTTMKHFIKHSHINAKLIRAVVKQSGGWDSFKESARDMAYAIDGGFSGFTWYADTVPFFQRHRSAIMETLYQEASDLGEDVITMIQNFGCFRNDKPSADALGMAIYAGRGDRSPLIH